jgi:hypothetical protein
MLTWLLLLKLSATKQVIPNVPFFRGQPNGMINFILSFLETYITVRNNLIYMQVIFPSSAFSNSNSPEFISPCTTEFACKNHVLFGGGTMPNNNQG